MRTIVTTTIHSPTEAILKFCNKEDWMFIIVGDMKTPHNEYFDLQRQYPNVRYLTPGYQSEKYRELSDILGWNTIQRRNIGFAEAYNEGADIIATIDDDNIPYDDWGKDLRVNKTVDVHLYEPNQDVFDPLSITEYNHLWHRGYPIELLEQRINIRYKGRVERKVLVQADLWDGDPDIDAIARIIFSPTVKFTTMGTHSRMSAYCSNVISPFNSQNTFLSRDVFPYYAMLPFIGRMDDIWGSYLLQKTFPDSVIYSKASVYQERNKQDLIKNLEDEIIGYKYTLKYIRGLYELPKKTQEFYEIYKKQFKI